MIKALLPVLVGLFATLLPLSSNAETDKPIDAATRAEVVDLLSQSLIKHYVFLDKAQTMAAAIRDQEQRGSYDNIVDGKEFASKLTDDLQGVSHDKHMRVEYSISVIPKRDIENRWDADAAARAAAPKKPMQAIKWEACRPGNIQHFYFGSTECLPDGIGLLVLNGFVVKEEAEPFLTAAMNRLANTRALIIDVRNNNGGDSDTGALLCGYLFEHAVQLEDFYTRDIDHTEHTWTSEKLAGKKYGQKKDVYVLTSSNSFSSAEQLSYDLQAYKRATLVGETTKGGAHPISILPLGDHFEAFMPYANGINPITKTNWEGVGVVPDVAVQAYDALYVAQVLELRKMMKSERNAKRQMQLRAHVQELQAQMIGSESLQASR